MALAQASGTKILYVQDDQSLTRVAQAGDTVTPVTIGDEGLSADWQMTPSIPAGKSLTLKAGNATAVLDIAATGEQFGNARPVVVELRSSSGLIASDSFNVSNANDQYTATLTIASDTTLVAGDFLVLRIYNNEDAPANRERSIAVSQQTAADGASTLSFFTTTVVNIDSVAIYSAAYPATSTQPLYDDGETVYLRVIASDPFGGADVSGATVNLTDATSTLLFSGIAMTQVASSAATRTYEYAYTLQAGAADGSWVVDATASEGSEGTITHSATANFNVGVPQLAVAKSHAVAFTAGGSGSFDLVVHNNGPPLTGTTTVTDTLAAGLGYVSGAGTGWSCGAVGQLVTCTNAASIATGADLPTLSLTLSVAGSVGSTVSNFATVSHPSVNAGAGQDSNTDIASVLHPILSENSGKDVVDLNGGDADPGDTLRYTITLAETAGAVAGNVSVTDDMPANITGFSVVSVPAGSADASTGGGGANGTGYLDITGITVPANGSVAIVFDVTVAGSAQPGDSIDNSADIDNPDGDDVVVDARTVTVSQSQATGAGNKVLYAYDDQSLTRTPQGADSVSPVDIAGSLDFDDWTMTPDVAAGKTLVLTAGDITAALVMATSNNGLTNARPVSVELRTSSGTIATSAGNASVVGATPALYGITITVPQTTLVAGDHLVMRVRNELTGNAGRHIAVYQKSTGVGASTLTFATSTVVNVDSVALYDAPYPAVTTQPVYQQGDTVYVRAVVSDPFGSADASGAKLAMIDVNGTTQLGAASMTQVADSGVATRTFEYAYALPGDAAIGFWTARVTGQEGSEGTVTHVANQAFGVGVSTLSINKLHSGNFTAGSNASYSIVVHNNSPGDVTGTTTVTDTLDASLSFVSATGTGWSCGAVGQAVTCTSTDTIVADSDLPALTLVVAVAGSAGTSIDNLASVANTTVDGGAVQPGNVDSATIVHPDLSSSSKDVVDLNGGDAEPGDTLRYTITLAESAGLAATNVSVTDNIPANVTGFTVVSVPGGSSDASAGGGGTNGTGYLDVTGISVPASGSVTIVFDVTVAAGAQPGDNIDNSATVVNPNGPGASPAAHTVTVSQSQVAGSGNKLLYPYDNASMTRTPQAANTTTPVTIVGGGAAFADWQMTPAVATGKSLVLSAGDVTATLVMAASNAGPTNARPVTVELRTSTGTIATSASVNVSGATTTTTNAYTFTITVPPTTLLAGDYLVMRVLNGIGTGNRYLAVYQKTIGNGRSTLSLDTSTVVNVDSVAAYSAAYPAVTTSTYYVHGNSVYLRAVASDPFGSADVDHATLTVTDSSGTVKLASAPMTLLADSGTATRTFGYGYVIPVGAKLGTWTASVTAYEGTEGTVTHTANAPFEVRGRITLGKAWSGATAGDTVDLAITGGSNAVAGSSTAPASTTAATAAATAAAAITLAESFSVGAAGNYTPSLACTNNKDGSVLAVAGTGLSRTITMPVDSSVTCTFSNDKTIALTVIKLSTVYSDPVNGTVNPKAIPGAMVDYQVIVTNPSANPVDSDTIVIRDPIPAPVELRVADFGGAGTGPVAFTDGAPSSGLGYTFTSLSSTTDDVSFSNDGGATWSYVPTPDGNGCDTAVTGIRINPKGLFNGNNAQFSVKLRVRVE